MKKISVEILTIGDEILYGQIVDTNSQWMSSELGLAGFRTTHKTTVGDVRDDILNAFQTAEKRADIILITGGLGPTNDDLTKPILAEYFNCGLKIDQKALKEITSFFEKRGKALTEVNRQQAALPEVCEKITNRLGTAPAMWFDKAGKVFVSMPGVPHEMKVIMQEEVIPRLRKQFQTPALYHKMVRTIGIGESFLAEQIKDWEKSLPPHIKLAYLPSMGQVKLRLTATGDDIDKLKDQVAELVDQLYLLIGKFIYGEDKEEIQEAIGKLLRENKLTLSTAESCTGGYLAHLITQVPGSSDYYEGSIISYSNMVKTEELGIKTETLKRYGVVSEETVREMAENVRKKLNTSIGLATTGVAGPGGGADEKPVGTVWIAYADENKCIAQKLHLTSERLLNIKLIANVILNLLRIQILNSLK